MLGKVGCEFRCEQTNTLRKHLNKMNMKACKGNWFVIVPGKRQTSE